MEIPAGNDFTGIGEHQRVIGGTVEFDFKDLPGMGQYVTHRAVNLRDTPQAVGILDSSTIFV